jgi:hypothetical protein
MKVVHVTPEYAAPVAFCGHRVRYLTRTGRGSADPTVGWSVVGFMETYHLDEQKEGVWEFCEGCLASADYALHLLGEV